MNRTIAAADARNFRQMVPENSWSTPDWLFAELNDEFGFQVDVCAEPGLQKCDRFFTPSANGLMRQWAPRICWMNPPYSDIAPWTKKAVAEARAGATVVGLLPVRADLAWFHRDVILTGAEVRFVRGRLRFGNAKKTAPFASMIVVWRPSSVRKGEE